MLNITLPLFLNGTAAALNGTAVGWVGGADTRGTLDIIWNCALTIVLCVWVSTYPNAGSPEDKWIHTQLDKFYLALIGLLGPDFLLGIALGQVSSARRCLKLFKDDKILMAKSEEKKIKWNYRLAFFLNMGGIHLKAPKGVGNSPEAKEIMCFPINGQQFHYLLKHKYVKYPRMKRWAIDERNSVDSLSRALSVGQALWFIVTIASRCYSGLPITTLELTTLNFVIVMIFTTACWFKKPAITKPQIIPTKGKKSIMEIRQTAKNTTHPDLDIDTWYGTPLDFASNERWRIGSHWDFYIRILEILKIPVFSRPMKHRGTPGAPLKPWDRIPSDKWLPPELLYTPVGVVVLLLFSVSFLFAWYFYFPTEIERTAWRWFAGYHAFFGVHGGLYYLFEAFNWRYKQKKAKKHDDDLEYGKNVPTEDSAMEPLVNSGKAGPRKAQLPPYSSWNPRGWSRYGRNLVWDWLRYPRNISVDGDPSMAMPLYIIIPYTITCVLYIITRVFLYMEDLVGLRVQPASLYMEPDGDIPFIGL